MQKAIVEDLRRQHFKEWAFQNRRSPSQVRALKLWFRTGEKSDDLLEDDKQRIRMFEASN